jgi:hypothetical protein
MPRPLEHPPRRSNIARDVRTPNPVAHSRDRWTAQNRAEAAVEPTKLKDKARVGEETPGHVTPRKSHEDRRELEIPKGLLSQSGRRILNLTSVSSFDQPTGTPGGWAECCRQTAEGAELGVVEIDAPRGAHQRIYSGTVHRPLV